MNTMNTMDTINIDGAVTLHTTMGLIQHAPSVQAMLEAYNEHGRWYDVRVVDGQAVLWHNGHQRVAGVFKIAA